MLKKIKDRLAENSQKLSDRQLDRRIRLFRALSVYYGIKTVAGGVLVIAGGGALAAPVIGVTLPIWLSASAFGIGAFMAANSWASRYATEKARLAYQKVKAARQAGRAEPLPPPATEQDNRPGLVAKWRNYSGKATARFRRGAADKKWRGAPKPVRLKKEPAHDRH